MLHRGRCHQLEPRMQVLHQGAPPFPLPFPQLEPSDKGAKRVLYQLTEEMDKRGGRLALVLAGELMTPADDPC